MKIADLIAEIESTIRSLGMDREDKVAKLKQLAQESWGVVFPERGTPAYSSLTVEEPEARWRPVRSLVKRSPLSDNVFYVLDWPASGGSFPWIS